MEGHDEALQAVSIIVKDDSSIVERIGPINTAGLWMNGGFFVLSNRIFDYIEPGDELVEQPFERLIGENKLSVVRYGGFWQAMDTLKDKISFDRMYARGHAPWAVWDSDRVSPD